MKMLWISNWWCGVSFW